MQSTRVTICPVIKDYFVRMRGKCEFFIKTLLLHHKRKNKKEKKNKKREE